MLISHLSNSGARKEKRMRKSQKNVAWRTNPTCATPVHCPLQGKWMGKVNVELVRTKNCWDGLLVRIHAT